jgi:holin-like protein
MLKEGEGALCIDRLTESKKYIMKAIKIIAQIALLFVFYFIGERLRDALHLSIPGSIIGLLLLLAVLSLKILPVQWIEEGSGILLKYLPFLLIPATVGVMNFTSIFQGKEALLIIITIISTLITMIISGHASQFLARYFQKKKEDESWKEQSSQSQ